MKQLGAVVLMAVLGALATVSPAVAESERIAVNIPFDFVVGNQTLKAGEYKVVRLDSGVLELWGNQQQRRFALVVAGAPLANHKANAYLLFNRYGDQRFLSKVALSVDGNFDLLQGKREKQLASQANEGALVVQPIQ
ncbi:MAG TPA: hypothetical protein VMH04_01310 [Candidatus Solibacter sp.]|nr:hypothetical protein [Candidatus Solibacter sp.]